MVGLILGKPPYPIDAKSLAVKLKSPKVDIVSVCKPVRVLPKPSTAKLARSPKSVVMALYCAIVTGF